MQFLEAICEANENYNTDRVLKKKVEAACVWYSLKSEPRFFTKAEQTVVK